MSIFRDTFRRASSFKFFNMWTLHSGYNQLVYDNWFYVGGGTARFVLKKKLARMKQVLKQLNGLHFSHISIRAKRANDELVEAQNRVLQGNGVSEDMVGLRRKAKFLLEAERSFLSQKRSVNT